MGVIIVKLGDGLQVVDVKRKETLTLKEGFSSAQAIAPVVKQIAESANPIGIFTGRTTKQTASSLVTNSKNLTPEQKAKFHRELNSYVLGDIVKFENAVNAAALGPVVKKLADAARKKPPLLVIFRDP